jgi:hypothetical protein
MLKFKLFGLTFLLYVIKGEVFSLSRIQKDSIFTYLRRQISLQDQKQSIFEGAIINVHIIIFLLLFISS